MTVTITPARASKRYGSVTDLRILCDELVRNGFDPEETLANADVSPTSLTRTNPQITRRQERNFQGAFAAVTRHRMDMWVDSARRRGYTSWGDFGMAMITAPTLRDIRELTVALGGGGTYPRVEGDRWLEGTATSFDDEFAPGTAGFQFQVVRELISGVDFFNELWRSKFPFARIEVPAEVQGLGLEDYVDAPLRFQTGPLVFLWSREHDTRLLPRGDDLLHREYVARVDRQEARPTRIDPIEEQVRAVLAQLSDSTPGLDDVAVELGLTARTLQRRLADRGFAFRALRETARIGMAKHLLVASNSSIGDIARSIGYLEVSSFSHAFRRLVGESPSAYRQSRSTADVRLHAA